MPQIRAILGHVSVETAKRKRDCWRHRRGLQAHNIVMGEKCLVVKDGDGNSANYCMASAAEILDRAETELAALRKGMGL